MSEDLNRDELFDKHNFDAETVVPYSDSEEEKEMLLQFVENALRKIEDKLNGKPSFDQLWAIKHLALPFSIPEATEYREDKMKQDFLNSLGSEVTYIVWLIEAHSLVMARFLLTMQYMFGTASIEGNDRQWYENYMMSYWDEVTLPMIELVKKFAVSVDWNLEETDKNNVARDITSTLFDKEMDTNINLMSEEYKSALDKIHKKLSSLYLESIVLGGDIETDEI